MKLRIRPQEYEAIMFKGITKELDDFLKGTDSMVVVQGECFVLSGFVGHQGLDIGDYLYKTNSPLAMIHIAHNDQMFGKYFEVVDEAN